jgi:hypothetical protein
MFRRHPTPGCRGTSFIRRVYAYLPTRSHDQTSSDTGCEQRRLGPRHHTQALNLWTMRAGPITDLGAQSHGAAIQLPCAFVRTELSLSRINWKSCVAPESHYHLYAASSLCVWPHTQRHPPYSHHVMRGAPARSSALYSAPPYWWTMRAGPTTNSVAQSHGACHRWSL